MAFRLAGLVFLAACGTTDAPEAPRVAVDPAAPVLRRLTAPQYTNALHDLFGDALVVPAKLEPDLSIDGLVAIGASRGTVSSRGVELYEEGAFLVAEQVVVSPVREMWVPCTPTSAVDSACAREALSWLAWRAWRRPVTEAEQQTLVALADEAAAQLGDFHLGLQYGVAAVLQAPSFLYREEVGEPRDGGRLYSSHEMASRLAFFLWNTLPDEELLELADSGDLNREGVLVEQVHRMVHDDRARQGLRAFVSELYHLDRLDDLTKDPALYPHMSEALGPAAREETLLAFEHVFLADEDYRDLLTTRRAYVDATLASVYGVQSPTPEGFGLVMLPEDEPRAGLLGQAAILGQHAHPTSSSPTLRGKFIRETLLCQVIPPPPADVDTSIPEPSGTAPTLRDRVAEHLEDPTCAGCHLLMDPLGLALEPFDGIGRYRLRDNGVLIDASGDLDGETYEDAEQLGQVLASDPDLGPCFTEQMYRYATGRNPELGELDLLEHLGERFTARGHSIQRLMMLIALSEGFRTAAPPSGELPTTQEEAG